MPINVWPHPPSSHFSGGGGGGGGGGGEGLGEGGDLTNWESNAPPSGPLVCVKSSTTYITSVKIIEI